MVPLGHYNDPVDSIGNFFKRTADSVIWRLVLMLLILPCLGAFAIRENMTANADFLGGRPEIERFLKVNVLCLGVAVAVFLIELVLFFLLCVQKSNSITKLAAFTGSMIVSIVTVVMFTYSVVNIRRDLKSTTKAELHDYVLSNTSGEYYLAFDDKGEHAIMPVKKEFYDELSKGAERTDGLHSVIYDMVTADGDYSNVTEYKDKLTVEYYFNSVMIENAKLEK